MSEQGRQEQYLLLSTYQASETTGGLHPLWENLASQIERSGILPGPGRVMTRARAGEIAAGMLAAQYRREVEALDDAVREQVLAGTLSDDDPLVGLYSWSTNQCHLRADLVEASRVRRLTELEDLYGHLPALPFTPTSAYPLLSAYRDGKLRDVWEAKTQEVVKLALVSPEQCVRRPGRTGEVAAALLARQARHECNILFKEMRQAHHKGTPDAALEALGYWYVQAPTVWFLVEQMSGSRTVQEDMESYQC